MKSSTAAGHIVTAMLKRSTAISMSRSSLRFRFSQEVTKAGGAKTASLRVAVRSSR